MTTGFAKYVNFVYTTYQQIHYSDNLLIHSTAAACFDVCTAHHQ
jgi:hypothetical protein